jgi:hypothetical protein
MFQVRTLGPGMDLLACGFHILLGPLQLAGGVENVSRRPSSFRGRSDDGEFTGRHLRRRKVGELGPGGASTSRRPRHPGSMPSKASSPSSQTAGSAAAYSNPSRN